MTVLAGARVVTPTGVIEDGRVEIAGGRITAVGPASTAPTGQDLGGGWLLPGFIDIHMHGGGGFDVTTSAADMAAAVDFHRRRGTTRTLVSLMAQPIEVMCEQLEWVARLTAAGEIVGAHLEGPFLSEIRCGAQLPENLLMPDPLLLRKLLEAGQGSVRSVTLAPELPGAMSVISELVGAGVIAAVGHTDASYEQALAAFDAGAKLATHLFNAMGSFNQRAPGPSIAALDSDAFVELINDGVHVHESLIRLAASSAADRLIFITDAISATGVGDGEYSLGDQVVRVVDGEARSMTAHGLAGSTLTMDEAVRRAVQVVGLPIELAAAAAASTPARLLGLDDRCGAIAEGLAADLVLLDDELQVQKVMVAGSWR
jgi:N-acetylglucosamine-6-phosphate deacetylase